MMDNGLLSFFLHVHMPHEYTEISGSERILYAGLYAVDLHWSSEWNYPPSWVVLGFWILVKPYLKTSF